MLRPQFSFDFESACFDGGVCSTLFNYGGTFSVPHLLFLGFISEKLKIFKKKICFWKRNQPFLSSERMFPILATRSAKALCL